VKKKTKRKRSKVKAARQAIDRAAHDMQSHGINPRIFTVRIGGQKPQRWQPPEQPSMQK
jgi:hypothetical protein